ncbi:MAG: hypothetical protein EOO27_40715, partial [Comamonadaceae bacterium]
MATGVPQDGSQAPHGGKVANDHNKTGNQPPTQTNQGQRTPESRLHVACVPRLPHPCARTPDCANPR